MRFAVVVLLSCMLIHEVSPQQLPNGMSCYTCINNTCSGTIQCVGDQNYCVSVNTAWSLNCYECVLGITNCQEKSCPDKCLTATTSVYVDNTKISDVNIQSCSTADSCISGSMNLGKMKVTNNGKCCSTPLCNTEKLPALQRQSVNGRMCYTCDDKGCYGTVNCEGDEDRCISLTAWSLECYPYTYDYDYTGTFTNCSSTCSSTTTTVDIYLVSGVSGLSFTTVDYDFSCGSPEKCVNTSINIGVVRITNNTQCCSTNHCNNDTLPVAQGTKVMTMKGCTTSNMCNVTLLRAHGLILTDVYCCAGNLCNAAESFALSFLLMFIPLLSFILF
ncbi:phospholipase A2 inhibitor CNF-like [Silurus meridionalis]|nr:phospholipase A2 inhibitor CNF-like [Silurus meridionalis]